MSRFSLTLRLAGTVASKELKDFFRDPRSILLSLALPLVLFPLLFWVLSGQRESDDGWIRIYRIGIEPGIDRPPWIPETAAVTLVETEESRSSEWRSRYDALVIARPDTGIPALLYDNADPVSAAAYSYLLRLSTTSAGEQTPPEEIAPAAPQFGLPLFEPDVAAGKAFLALILPFMFFIFAITCPLPVSADLSAGEKERASLEPLLSTASPRTSIVCGKLGAAFAAGACSVVAYLSGIGISCIIAPEIMGDQQMSFPMALSQVSVLALLLVGLVALFTAVEMCAGFITRSVREAQLLSMPLLMLGMAAVYTGQNITLGRTPYFFFHIPLVNTVLAIREAALGRMTAGHIICAVLWNLIYILGVTALMRTLFNREILYSGKAADKTLLAIRRTRQYSKSKD